MPPEFPAPSPFSRPARVLRALALAGLGLAVVDAARRAWFCDDAFISFRYALNWVRGEGLVYNPGERVEGYTNFLWTILVGIGMHLGLTPEKAAAGLGLAAWSLLLVVLYRWSAGHRRPSSGGPGARSGAERAPWRWPLAATGFAAIFHARIFATSGLETPLFSLLVTVTVLASARACTPRGWLAAGAAGTLATLTRPDGGLFLLAAGLAAVVTGRARSPGTRRRHLLAVLAVPAAVLLPYAGWKLHYYGHLLPNTFHAKSAGESWYDQGAWYLWSFFSTYPVAGAAVAAALWLVFDGLWHSRRPGQGGTDSPSPSPSPSSEDPPAPQGPPAPRRVHLLLSLPPLAFLFYVGRVGGDFMFGRFCIPVVPLLLLGLERVLFRLPTSPRIRTLLALGCTVALLFNPPPPPSRYHPRGIVDEWRQYPPDALEQTREVGLALRPLLEGLKPPVRIVIYGYQATLAYYADPPVVVEGLTGLTERDLARTQLQERGRPGHEKKATPAYLRRRGVHFLFAHRLDLPPGGYTEIDFGPTAGRIIRYVPALMEQLAARGARFTDFPRFLDDYLARLEETPPGEGPADQVAQDYADFQVYYFDHAEDPEREARFERWLEAARGAAPYGAASPAPGSAPGTPEAPPP